MTAVVTGAAGHVGANLVRALLAAGKPVRAVVRDDTRGVEGLPLELIRGDMLDPASLLAAFEGAEVVFHLASVITVAGDPTGIVRRTNVEGARNVAEACLAALVRRLVHFSSIHAFDARPRDEIIDESRPRAEEGGGQPIYDRTKAAGEREILAAVERGLDAVIVNPTAVLGPFDFKPSRMGRVIRMLATGTMPALVGGGFDWVDARDVTAGALAAAERGRTGERYLLSGRWTTFTELARIVATCSGTRLPRFTSPMWLARLGAPFVSAFSRLRGTEPLYTGESLHALRNHRRISSARASAELDYAPRPLEQTIADTVSWFDKHEGPGEKKPRSGEAFRTGAGRGPGRGT
ncbi:MAG TPA: SDR family oxidoreductase [Polyangia bacterium]|nr:SDR family oxidoreductase [Polyangia bacterium]